MLWRLGNAGYSVLILIKIMSNPITFSENYKLRNAEREEILVLIRAINKLLADTAGKEKTLWRSFLCAASVALVYAVKSFNKENELEDLKCNLSDK